MPVYTLEVTKDEAKWDQIYVTLYGDKGQSERTVLDHLKTVTATTQTCAINTNLSLGTPLLVKMECDPLFSLHEDQWYCSKIVVTTPDEDVISFPCYRWIDSEESVELRGGRAMRVREEHHTWLKAHRVQELERKKKLYQWKIMAEGLPYINSFNDQFELPAEIQFTKSKLAQVHDIETIIGLELSLKDLHGSKERWESLEHMKYIFHHKHTPMAEYVTAHWREDDFYGWQFLNGVNPNVIKRCSALPPNFPVTTEMVKRYLEEDTTLEEEIENGKIFLYDQRKMDGIATRDYYDQYLYVTPGLCLFYLDPKDRLMPIAIQLQQEPSCHNPIFLPHDDETDWLLAKMFIKNADFMDHEAVHHLMNTHFLAEVFTLATLRCLPEIHPLYKLLIPHFRYTLFINTGGRKSLFGHDGVLHQSSLGYDGLIELMRRSFSETTYSSLCLPENIAARGLESIPNFYYRDDGLKLWNIINNFVMEIVEYYYSSDCEVQEDTELQEWIAEIFLYGFLGNKASGIPQSFDTVEDLVKFVTMVIFTTSAQHAGVNNGQFDYHSWVPNGSLLLRKPPPTTKGDSDMDTILDTLPNIGETVSFVAMTVLLSEEYSDVVPLGTYPEERFSESGPKKRIKDFQEELISLSQEITERNKNIVVGYTYLNPNQMENSITI